MNDKSIKKVIYEEVLKLGGTTQRKGFELLVAAIEKIIYNPTMQTMKLYDELANEFNDIRSRVERSIRYYVECVITDGNQDELSKLHFKVGKTGAPTVTEFVRVFALYIKLNYNLDSLN